MKYLKTFLFIIAIIGLLPVIAAAASFTFSPTSGEYTEGQTYSVSVYVSPQDSTVYTTKAEIIFPADMVEVRSFAFGPNWIPLSQPGYDATDNSGGILIKTGGYTGGLTSPALLGNITFFVKKTGSAKIKIGDGSLLLDGNNANALSASRPEASFVLVKKPVLIKTIQKTSAPDPQIEVEAVQITTDDKEGGSDDANIAAVGETGSNNVTLWILEVILGATFIGLLIFFWKHIRDAYLAIKVVRIISIHNNESRTRRKGIHSRDRFMDIYESKQPLVSRSIAYNTGFASGVYSEQYLDSGILEHHGLIISKESGNRMTSEANKDRKTRWVYRLAKWLEGREEKKTIRLVNDKSGKLRKYPD